MRLHTNDTIAMAIDYQEKLVPAMREKDKLISNSYKLIKGLEILDIPVVYTQQYTKGLGMTISELIMEDHIFEHFEKIKYSCYADESIRDYIDLINKRNIILCGVEAHICVLQTALDLKEAGYNVILVTDCIDSRKEIDKEMAIKRAIQEDIYVTTYESVLFELLGGADDSKFKEISNLIK